MHGARQSALLVVPDQHEGLVRDIVVVDLLDDHDLVRLQRAPRLRQPLRR